MPLRAGPTAVVLTFFLLAGGALLIAMLGIAASLLLPVGLVLYPLFLPFMRRYFGLPDLADEVLFTETADGQRLALHHHRPANPHPGALPVILCHGTATDKFGVDLDESHSIAIYLKRRGFDVFALDLRGSGLSRGPRSTAKARFNFDDLVRMDAPTAVRAVLHHTGAPSVNWVGYSLGGMIACAFCGSAAPEAKSIAAIVALGSPGNADHIGGKIADRFARNPWIKLLLPLQPGAAILAPFAGLVQTPVDRLLYDPDIVKRSTVVKLLRNAIHDINQGLVDQLAGWVRERRETSADGMVDYRACFRNIRAPTLFIAGAADRMAPPEQVLSGYRKCGAREKRFVLAGKAEGFNYDYCHIGLAMGEEAPREIFPIVDEWLQAHGALRRRKGTEIK